MDKKEIREIFKENREVEELLKKENERIIRSLIEKYSTEGLELFIRNGFLLKKGGVFITTHKEFFPNGYNQTICLRDDYDNQFYSYNYFIPIYIDKYDDEEDYKIKINYKNIKSQRFSFKKDLLLDVNKKLNYLKDYLDEEFEQKIKEINIENKKIKEGL